MKVLFVCSRNRLRSLTAETVFDGVGGHEVRSAGTEPGARIRVTAGHLGWADLIFVMEKRHLHRLREKFSDVIAAKRVVCLYIPDDFEYMDEDLIDRLRGGVAPYVSSTSSDPGTRHLLIWWFTHSEHLHHCEMSERSSRADRVDRVLSLSAGIAAITAVAVSLYQTALAREQLRASAWPYIAQANSLAPGEPYRRTVVNEGVGPARIRTFEVLVDGRPMRGWNEVVTALTGSGEPALLYSSFRRGAVLQAGATRTLLTLPSGQRATEFWRQAQHRLVTRVCYCSIYDEC